ncbi:MAG: hypothetical protein KDK70_21825 [Myxococcales bacterium]|nr:hypothetical protein [Myxococcales bacterium]
MTPRRPLPLLGLLGLLALPLSACGRDEAPPKAEPKPESEPETKQAPPPSDGTGGTTGGATTTGADPFANDDWAEDDTEAAATMGIEPGTGDSGEAPTVPLYDGPCFVRWSKGPILRFKYDADGGGGQLRIDGDNDGTVDVCARFWTKDRRTHKVSVDEACDKSVDAIITPTYEEGLNLATASYTDKRGEAEVEHEITLITLPAFTGIAPGYPLYAKRDDVKLEHKDGRVTKATVKTPVEGPPVKVSLTYDGEGRVTRIDEDHEADGKVDRRFDYRYDDVGNVVGMTLTETVQSDGKRKKSKKTATLGYRCWAEPS